MTQRDTQIVADFRALRITPASFLEAAHRLRKFALMGQHNPKAIIGAGMPRHELEGPAIIRLGLGDSALRLADRTQKTPGIGVRRINLQYPAIKLLREVIATRLMVLQG